MRIRQRRPVVGTLALLLVLLAACGSPSDSSPAAGPADDPNATLRFGLTVAPAGLDPHRTPSPVAQTTYVFPLYDRLTQVTQGPKLEPMVATAWSFSPDSRSVTFTLRPDVTFHDGTPLTADAVKQSLDRARLLPASTVKSYLSMISDVVAVDGQTLRIDAHRPAADLPYVLSTSVGSIINPKSIGRSDLDTRPDGSGPFVAAEVKLGDRVTYTRAPSYWDPAASKLAGLQVIAMTNDNARLSALRSGQIDAMTSKIGQYEQTSALGPGFEFHSYPAAAVYTIWLNTAKAPIDRVKVRQALNYAIDRDALNKGVLAGQCAPSSQPLPEVYEGQGHLDDPPVTYTRDVARARALLAEAGLPGGFTMTMLTGAGLSPQDKMAPVLQAQLAEIGVTVTIDAQDPVQVNGKWGPNTPYESYLQVKSASPTGAITLRDGWLLPSRYPGPQPEGFAAAVGKAFDACLSPEQVDRTLQQASSIAVDQAMDVFLCAVPTQSAYSERVKGLDTAGQADFQGIFDLRYVSMSAVA